METPVYPKVAEARQSYISRLLAACCALLLIMVIAMSTLISRANASVLGEAKGASPQCDPYWQVVSTPGAVNGGALTGISAISASDIWAVGYYSGKGGYKTLTMHWDGVSWSLKNAPNGSTQNNYLYGVKAISANDVWAVGASYINNASTVLTLHWNGANWAMVSSPNPGGHLNILSSVTALSSGSVWAVGRFQSAATGFTKTLTMHWDGAQWTTVTSPNPSPQKSNYLYGVTVAGTAHSDVWAVGCYASTSGGQPVLCDSTLTLRWNPAQQQWDVVASPNPGSGERYLYGITAVSANELWAVGTFEPNGGSKSTLILRYINNVWSYVPSPSPYGSSGSYLRAVSAVAANNVWAAGEYTSSSGIKQTLIEHWNGTDWVMFITPNVGTDHNQLSGVAAVSATEVWSVGYLGGYPNFDLKTLAERYNPCS